MLKKRLPWMVLLLLVETLTVVALKSYESMLVLLAMFMPLINATAGNTGNQVAGLMIRGFAVKEIELMHWYRVFMRELVRGVVMGAALGLVSCGIVLVFQHNADRWKIAWAVAMAMLVAVVMANVIGAMLPFVFKRFGIDPAITSGPFIAGLMDVSSIVIFFTIAHNIMNVIS
jgi:magnesium transporter